jgi:hypothetical protein
MEQTMADLRPDDLVAIRGLARALGERAASDGGFRERLEQDPIQTLIDAGLPPDAVADLLVEEGWSGGEVQGFIAATPGRTMLPPTGRCGATCVFTAGSCSLTIRLP